MLSTLVQLQIMLTKKSSNYKTSNQKNPEAIVVVIGCYAQISTSDVLDIEGVDIIIGNEGKDKIIELVEEYKKNEILLMQLLI